MHKKAKLLFVIIGLTLAITVSIWHTVLASEPEDFQAGCSGWSFCLKNLTDGELDRTREIYLDGELAASGNVTLNPHETRCFYGDWEGQDVYDGYAHTALLKSIEDDEIRETTFGLCGNPDIDIEKATNGEDADDPTGPEIPVGDPVYWTYIVTKVGNVDLTDVTVTDEDSSHYSFIPSEPDIDIEKATNGEDADDPTGPEIPVGDAVYWTYVVTNIGNVDLTDVTVTDDQGATVSCPQNTLAAGESMTCDASGTAVAGQYANLGAASGDYGDTTVTDEDPSHYIGFIPAEPDINIEKATNGKDADDPTGPEIPVGDPVYWTYVVTNVGNVDLTDVTVTDDQGVTVSCPQNTLAAGESMTCDASGTAVAGQYANLGAASGDYGDTTVTDEDPSHYIGFIPSEPDIDIEKATNGEDADDPTGPEIPVGDPVYWTYVVTNVGNVDLTDVTVTDDQGVTVSCPQNTLAAGESMTCDASGTAVAGQYANLGAASGDYGDTTVTDEDPSHYIGFIPSEPDIDIEKATNGEDADDPTGPEIPVGNAVYWTYVVTNIGNVNLIDITVTDDQGVAVDCPQITLAAGESIVCTASGVAEEGQYANLGTVTGKYGDTTVTDEDPSHYIGFIPAEPDIDIEKATNGEDADDPTGPEIPVGDPVYWTYVVTNIGSVDLTDVTVTDDQGVAVDCPQTILAAGESMTCDASGTAVAGQYANLGTVAGKYGDTTVSDEDPSHYFGADGNNCTRTQGYWKNHPDDWPVDELVLGDKTYTKAELLDLFDTPPEGDASLILAHQLIAAKLNVASGADDSGIASTIVDADDWLDNYDEKLPYDVSPDSEAGQDAIALAAVLDEYNNGVIGPGHCEDEFVDADSDGVDTSCTTIALTSITPVKKTVMGMVSEMHTTTALPSPSDTWCFSQWSRPGLKRLSARPHPSTRLMD